MPTTEGFYLLFYDTIMWANQTNDILVYVKLKPNYSCKLSQQQHGKQHMVPLTYFTASLKTNTTHLMDLCNRIWLQTT